MEVTEAIRSRRTVKAFVPEPLAHEELDELFELARWAPNHRLTGPWRFRVVGTRALAALKRAAAAQACASAPAGADAGAIAEATVAKLDRAPTLVTVSAVCSPDPMTGAEDVYATAIAAYIVLLAAHARGLAGYWRSPAILRDPAGLVALGVPDSETAMGLLYLGRTTQPAGDAPAREEPAAYVTYLD